MYSDIKMVTFSGDFYSWLWDALLSCYCPALCKMDLIRVMEVAALNWKYLMYIFHKSKWWCRVSGSGKHYSCRKTGVNGPLLYRKSFLELQASMTSNPQIDSFWATVHRLLALITLLEASSKTTLLLWVGVINVLFINLETENCNLPME